MATVQIKDEDKVGCEARFKYEPSAYLQKLYATGTPDLDWMNQHGEWGIRAKPGNLGLRLKNIEIGSYGVVPDHGSKHRSMAPRGAVVPEDVPSLDFTINEKAECWAGNTMELYEEVVARQWSSARDIPWNELRPLSDDLEHAMCQLCTFFTEVELSLPTRLPVG